MTTTTIDKNKTKTAVAEKDPAKDNAARERLLSARITLLLKRPFFGNLATRLRLVNADEWLTTAATDGKHFYYNTDFVLSLNVEELQFLFSHEIFHLAYSHLTRVGSRDKRLYNIACDYAVNGDLVKHKIGKMPKLGLYDKKYVGKSSEQIYDELLEDIDKLDIEELLKLLLDDHLDGEGEDSDGDSGKPKLSKSEKEQILKDFQEAMISAYQNCGANNLPDSFKRIITDLTEPKMNWREILRSQLESTIKSDYSWMRTSRKSWHSDAVMPGMIRNEAIDIAVAIDTSGSISGKMITDFLGEVRGIMDQFESYKVHVFCFDTKVHNPCIYESDAMDEIEQYEPAGGGGTLFECVFSYLSDNDIVPKKLVFFTDGYPCSTWGDDNYCDTLFVVHGNENIVAPFGVTAHYEPD